jgi:hypothetical protein
VQRDIGKGTEGGAGSGAAGGSAWDEAGVQRGRDKGTYGGAGDGAAGVVNGTGKQSKQVVQRGIGKGAECGAGDGAGRGSAWNGLRVEAGVAEWYRQKCRGW